MCSKPMAQKSPGIYPTPLKVRILMKGRLRNSKFLQVLGLFFGLVWKFFFMVDLDLVKNSD